MKNWNLILQYFAILNAYMLEDGGFSCQNMFLFIFEKAQGINKVKKVAFLTEFGREYGENQPEIKIRCFNSLKSISRM